MTGPLFECLKVFDDPVPHDGPLNMALDEVLLARSGPGPLLRIYRWRTPMVSIGYFEPLVPVRKRYPDREIVRRWTGGGIVEHGLDFTYSLLVPRDHPFARCTVAESYRVVHEAVADAMRRSGWDGPTLAEPVQMPAAIVSQGCFEKPVQYDLLIGGQKVAGAAQRRSRHGLLHQGSVQGGIAVASHGDNAITALGSALPKCLSANCQPRTLQAEESAIALELAAAKYGTLSWLERF